MAPCERVCSGKTVKLPLTICPERALSREAPFGPGEPADRPPPGRQVPGTPSTFALPHLPAAVRQPRTGECAGFFSQGRYVCAWNRKSFEPGRTPQSGQQVAESRRSFAWIPGQKTALMETPNDSESYLSSGGGLSDSRGDPGSAPYQRCALPGRTGVSSKPPSIVWSSPLGWLPKLPI